MIMLQRSVVPFIHQFTHPILLTLSSPPHTRFHTRSHLDCIHDDDGTIAEPRRCRDLTAHKRGGQRGRAHDGGGTHCR